MKNHIKIYCNLILFLFFIMALPGCSWWKSSQGKNGEGNIRGIVVDNSGNPVRGIKISSQPPTSKTISDGNGKFVIEFARDEMGNKIPIAQGSYLLRFQAVGFEPKSRVIQFKGIDFNLGQVVIQRKSLEISDDVDITNLEKEKGEMEGGVGRIREGQ